MWRLKRTDVPGVPDAVRVSVELADDPAPAAISPEALAAATLGQMPLTDTAVIAKLRQQLTARGEHLLRLQEELRARPEPVEGCVGCAGLRKTLADHQAAAKTDRRRIAELELATAAGRARTLPPPLPVPDPEA